MSKHSPQKKHVDLSVSISAEKGDPAFQVAVYLLFILSGAVGLSYEALWARYLKMLLGHSSHGQILTLMIYMGGLGIGSFIGARVSKSVGNPFRAYALVELGAGLCGLAYHWVFQASSGLFFANLHHLPQGMLAVVAAKVVLSVCITLPGAILLGMTFPLVAVGMRRKKGGGGDASIAGLYFTNSLGAACGVVVTSFVAIPLLGTAGALTAAAMGNVAVAAGFFVLSAWYGEGGVMAGGVDARSSKAPLPQGSVFPSPAILLLISALTGLSSFVYEIGWIRLLSLMFGSSTHSFDIMLSAFILGLALGALYIRSVIRPSGRLIVWLAAAQLAMGCFALLGLYFCKPLFYLMNQWHGLIPRTEPNYLMFSAFKYLIAAMLMGGASFCAGTTLPLITVAIVRYTRDEKQIGWVYGFNTVGAIIGAAAGGLVLLPLLQLRNMIAAAAGIDMLIGLALAAGTGLCAVPLRKAMLVGGALLFFVPLFFTRFDPAIIVSGVFLGPISIDAREQIKVRDGTAATISFHKYFENGYETRVIKTNGKPDASVCLNPAGPMPDEMTQASAAFIPMNCMRSPYTAAIIGIGSGMTAHYLLADSLCKRLDVIEIEKEVYNLAQNFKPYNHRLYDDPRVNVYFDDAKTFFHAHHGKTYDLIISEPSNPWVSGISGLFTIEYYRAIKPFLNKGGMLVQWIHQYEFASDLILPIVKSIDSVFPSVSIYSIRGTLDLLLLASDTPPFPGRFERPEGVGGDIALDFSEGGYLPEYFGCTGFIVSARGLKPLLVHYESNSDFNPVVDNGAEKAFFLDKRVDCFTPFVSPFASRLIEAIDPSGTTAIVAAKRLSAAHSFRPDTAAVSQLMALLTNVADTADWNRIDRLFFGLIPLDAPAGYWGSLPWVQLYREAVLPAKAGIKRSAMFAVLDAFMRGNITAMETSIGTVERTLSQSEINPVMATVMMIGSIQTGNSTLRRSIYSRYVADNPAFSMYEKAVFMGDAGEL